MKKVVLTLLIIFVTIMLPLCKVKASANHDSGDSKLYKEEMQAVQVFNVSDKKVYVTEDDLYLMAQIVFAESRSEPYEGKVAVASVILNRVQEPGFPKTIEEVIKQKNAFSCLKNGKIEVVPDEHSYAAVMEALNGTDPTDNAVFFYNPKIATSSWMKNIGKKNVKPIGNHVFFAVR